MAKHAGERRRLEVALSEKEDERERVLTLFRRGRATLEESEAQLDTIQREADVVRACLNALRAQADAARWIEEENTQATTMLSRLGESLADIEATGDEETKHRVMQLLVERVEVESVGHARRKRSSIAITYRFGPQSVLESSTAPRP